jgi:hypothetical protein
MMIFGGESVGICRKLSLPVENRVHVGLVSATVKRPGVKLTSELQLMQGLRMCEIVTSSRTSVFMF